MRTSTESLCNLLFLETSTLELGKMNVETLWDELTKSEQIQTENRKQANKGKREY